MEELSPDRWRLVSPYLDRALEMPEEQRQSWLEQVRTADATLADDLELLLGERSQVSREGFLEGTPGMLPATSSLAGQTFGAYTLISVLGRGGMGTVWLARRSDGRFEGEVAVKVLNASLVGRASEERFRREGNILARLADPHIARLLDAGVSPSGQPYLVLEYVEGEPIDRSCDKRGLSIEGRIHLFLDVLEAVGHAHANLIIHRDIKPSNVLVAGDRQVKLLDFGIAKALDGEGGAATALTREAGRALTPEFAAPEQVTGEPVTTATDVYALGILLYILLSGRHPVGESLRFPAEWVRAVVDTEPKRLSDAVVDPAMGTAEERLRGAAARATTPDGLRRLFAGDLDTIVAKALKKNPLERYASVGDFANDLRCFLRHEPIRARPDTLRYRTAKFVRRNRTAVALAAFAVTALAAGLVGTFTQARRAMRDAERAETQRGRADQAAVQAQKERDFALRQLSRAEAMNDLNAFLLSDAPSAQPFTAGQLLGRAEEILQRGSADSDENRVEMLIAIGYQYNNLDQDEKAMRLLSQAYALATKLPEPSLHAKAACALSNSIERAGETDRAEGLILEGLSLLPDQPQFALDRVFCLARGSYVAREAGNAKSGLERILEAQRLLRQSGLSSALGELTVSMDVAEAYRMAGRNREASDAFRQAFDQLSALGRGDTEKAGTLLNNWALAEEDLGRPVEAERLYRNAIRISSENGSEAHVSPMLMNNLARTLKGLSRFREAARYADRAYVEAKRAQDEIVINQSLIVGQGIYRELGDLARAQRMLAEVEPRLKRMLPAGHVAFASLASEEGLLQQARGDLSAAKANADRAVALAEPTTQRAVYLPLAYLRRANLELEMQQWAEARADAERAAALYHEPLGPGVLSSKLGLSELARGRALQELGNRDEARAAFAAAIANLEPSMGRDHPETRAARRLAAAMTGP